MSVLILSSSALTDRMLLHTNLTRDLRARTDVRIWATSAANPKFNRLWAETEASVEPFPEIRPFPEIPFRVARRFNDFAWDFHLRDPSRLSMMRHIRDQSMVWYMQSLKHPARLAARLKLQEAIEDRLERMMIAHDRSPEAVERLVRDRPVAVVAMGPMRSKEPAVVAAAKKLGIPVLAFITSWDNISIKNRMVFKYDGYLVWSERMKEELLGHYPQSRQVPVHIVGAPQFDAFFRPEFRQTRREFSAALGLRPELPIVVHAMGVANGVEEHHGALDLARRVAGGELNDAQLIVRPHPFQNHTELRGMFGQFGPRVVVQQQGDPGEQRHLRSQGREQTLEWVNTFRHADVVVHLSSTVAVDAALFDRPSVCMDYDPMPGQPRQAIVREVNHLWTHYKPVAESGGMWMADSPDQVVEGIRAYLANPALHAAERRRMAEFVCGYLDGQCGSRVAEAILRFVQADARSARGVLTAPERS